MSLRVRRSFLDVEAEHNKELQKPLDDRSKTTELQNLVLAFQKIQLLDPKEDDSFFKIAGYHGEPFRGAGWSKPEWWGGYCYHGQILFPSWHRAYCLRLEDALRKHADNTNLSLPFLDWCNPTTQQNGLPPTFTNSNFTLLDGSSIKNPLCSYKFQKGVYNLFLDSTNVDYTKQTGYETVRYPLAGLVGTPKDQADSAAHNAKYPYPSNNEYLNTNIIRWLTLEYYDDDKKIPAGVVKKFHDCLEAPNYVLFSNTSSTKQWNSENPEEPIVSLEKPHNAMHLAVGGYDIPGQGDYAIVRGANGDMGENDTASFDPIFFFHHAFIDYVFWTWQEKHHQTEKIIIPPDFERYPGTNNFDGDQGPTPGRPGNDWLTLDTPLDPFRNPDNTPTTTKDVTDITKLGYRYGDGSLSQGKLYDPTPEELGAVITTKGFNRASVRGSFLILTSARTSDGGWQVIDFEPVLSRNQIAGCANCQNHLPVKAFIPIMKTVLGGKKPTEENILVTLRTHDDKETLGKPLEWKTFWHKEESES